MAKPIKGTNPLVGTNKADKLQGKSGDDTIIGGQGNDNIDGGQGVDTAVYSGSFSDYAISFKGTGNDKLTVADSVSGRDGTDTLKNVEFLQFSDGVYSVQSGSMNFAPVITSNGGGNNASVNVSENQTFVTTVAANDANGDTLTYSIVGGADAAKFTINSSTGELSFVTAPDYEAPTDGGGNNVYDVIVQVSDGTSADTQAIAVAVTDANIQLFDSSGALIGDFTTLKQAVDTANSNVGTDFTIRIDDGTYAVGGSTVIIQKNIAIEGLGMTETKLDVDFNTTFGEGSGDTRGAIVVAAGANVSFSDLTIDGDGQQIDMAIRVKGAAVIEDVRFEDIRLGQYFGLGVSARPGAQLDISDSEFVNIGRVGAHFFGATGSVSDSSFTGKGAGDYLDYAVEAGGGAEVTITNNTVSGNLGIASDGSGSAGFLVSDFFGPGTQATFQDNMVTNSSTGAYVGFALSDASQVTFLTGNDFVTDVDYGVVLTGNVVATDTQLVNGTFDWLGGSADNDLSGANLADVLNAGAGNDTLTGFDGNDALTGGKGNDNLDGGNDVDTAYYSGAFNQYVITPSGTGITVQDTVANRDGTDQVESVEWLQFSDALYDVDNAISYEVNAALHPSAEDPAQSNDKVYAGNGKPSTGFGVVTSVDDGVELGLKVIYRSGPNVATVDDYADGVLHFAVNDGPQSTVNGSTSNAANRASWNFDWSIATNLNGDGTDLNDFTFKLLIDFDPSSGTDLQSFTLEPESPILSPTAGQHTSSNFQWRSDANPLQLLAHDDEGTATVTQNSQNYAFYGLPTYNAGTGFAGPAYFDITLQAYDGVTLIAQNHISVDVIL